MDDMTEEDVGIEGFTTATGAIACVFRERFSDFIVHEIDLANNVVELTDLVPPQLNDDAQGVALASKVIDDATLDELVGICGGDAALKVAIRALLDGEGASESVLLPASSDKAVRKASHQYVGNQLPSLAADTVDDPDGGDGKSVRIWRCGAKRKRDTRDDGPRQKGYKKPRDSRSAWPRHRAEFVRFAVYKENMETMKAVETISRSLHMRIQGVGFAGTKDRRAVTTQWMTVRKQNPAHVAAAVNNAKQVGDAVLKVGNFSFVTSELKLGLLAGNRFEVLLRRCEGDAAEACTAVSKSGFTNYFGLQRFGQGSKTSNNAVVGRAVLDGDWERCCDLVLAPRAQDNENVTAAKEKYAKKDFAGAADDMPHFMRPEKAVLEGLAQHGDRAFLNAFKCIDPKLQLMYLHAYQSLAWNRAASKRVKKHGCSSAVVGDLVLSNAKEQGESATSQLTSAAEVVLLTSETASQYTAFDVLIPMPGHAVTFPTYEGAEVYSEADLEIFKSETHSEYTLSGAYRFLLAQPKDLTWKLHAYHNNSELVAETDWDRLTKKDAPEEKEAVDAPFTGLTLSFSLPSSSYATCCLREITKGSMSKAHHAKRTLDATTPAPAAPEEGTKPPA